MMSANKNILSVSRLDIKPTGARQIRSTVEKKWPDPTWNVQIDLSPSGVDSQVWVR